MNFQEILGIHENRALNGEEFREITERKGFFLVKCNTLIHNDIVEIHYGNQERSAVQFTQL